MKTGNESQQKQIDVPEGWGEARADVVMDLHERIPPNQSVDQSTADTKGDELCPDTSPRNTTTAT